MDTERSLTLLYALVAPLLAGGCGPPAPDRWREPLVDVAEVVPGVVVDVRYATADNFMRRPLYHSPRCLLRKATAERLAKVQADLQPRGLRLKIYDGYRPLSVQREMWAVLPDSRFVADPARGSRHNRGTAVDVTLVDAAGKELEMPSGYDVFGAPAALAYTGGSETARTNRDQLVAAMKRRGFLPLASEWWHYDDPEWRRYPVLDETVR